MSRRCAFAWYRNTKGGSLGTADGEKTCSWWLRTPGMKDEYACTVWYYGDVVSRGENTSNIGINSDYGQNGVRPAIYISLK
ncbi:MAG: DUF6273 domain-containing protein [Lachnospiraceae bacterium]|nr:DUF6273 domain-containing protein [Lachnospiraceae bacterium]